MKFRAAVLRRPRERLTIETVEAGPLRRGDVLVRIRATSLCHTDLEVIEGQLVTPMPIVLGHEASGTIAALGEGAPDWRSAIPSSFRGIRIAATVFTANRISRSSAKPSSGTARRHCSSVVNRGSASTAASCIT